MKWNEFIMALDDVNWEDSNYLDQQAPIVEAILADVAAAPDLLRERTAEIASNEDLFDEMAAHTNYPRTLMDKFVIYVDPADRYRVRMHRFWPKRATGDVIEDVHDHKWPMSTVLLTGSYSESRFNVTHCDEISMTASVRLTGRATLVAGQTSSLAVRVPHQITNESMDEPCITLFVRGPSVVPNARIFDVAKGSFYKTYSPKPQVREGFLQIGRLNGVFHPVFAPR